METTLDRPKRSVSDVLAHYGVKGMRWGVRRSRSELARSSGKSSGDESKGKSKDGGSSSLGSSSSSSRSIRELSTSELQQIVNRMNLEQQYTRLASEISKQNAPAAKKQNAGKEFAKKLLADTAKREVTRVTGAAAKIAVEKGLQKQGGPTAAEIGKLLQTGAYIDKGKKKKK